MSDPIDTIRGAAAAQGGRDEPWNLMDLCGPDGDRPGCHRWAHDHVEEARRLGLIRERAA